MRPYWNKTKVICTIGPACAKRDVLKTMILAGMDIARFNFSHGKPADHISLIKSIKTLAAGLKSPLAILQDLPGPKVRIGPLQDDYVELNEGQRFFLTSKKIIGSAAGVFINNPLFIRQLKKKNIVYLNDGIIKLLVVSKNEDELVCEILAGGRIYPKKGVSCPGKLLDLDPVTDYDLECIKAGIKADVDFIGVSFVQRSGDILKVKNYLKKKGKNIFVIAKIERKVALEDIDQIINVSDAVMVARGDLGIDVSLEEIPFLQKQIIKKCNLLGRPVITATQMLESMVNNLQPTRAEVTDIANAVLDGTDALMLSEETAIGKHPVKCLQVMVKIASKAERELKSPNVSENSGRQTDESLVEAFSRSAVKVANNIKAKVIIVPTKNANSISWLSRLRPKSVVVGITTEPSTFKKLILFWGVYPVLIKRFSDLQQTLNRCVRLVKSCRLAKKNDNALIMLTEDSLLFASNIMEVRKIE